MQTPFAFQNGRLCAESVDLADIAEKFGTPTYVYSRAAIEQQWQMFDQAFGSSNHLICYAVKANSSLAILNLLARMGSGFDIVSAGELERVLAAGGDASKVVFSGVGKTHSEMCCALESGIKCFNVESIAELHRLNQVAGELGCQAPISFRINPDVDVKTHPYIATGLKENKFGIPFSEATECYQLAAKLQNIRINGIDCHIGSQITELEPFIDALNKLNELILNIEQTGISLMHIDIGGGLGIQYDSEIPPPIVDYVNAVKKIMDCNKYQIIIEPGRVITGNGGILLTRVEYLKSSPDKNFAIVDAAMNDLVRPALYDAWHTILPVEENKIGTGKNWDIVGPVCESGDFLGKDRHLDLTEGDLLAVCSAGAYGFTMSSNYNTRPRAAEIMVDKDQIFEIRKRESIADLFSGEVLLPDQ